MHCAGLPEQVWEALVSVFKAWKTNTVKGQPCKELKQTHMTHLFRLHDTLDKGNILKEMANGELSYADFKQLCLNGYVHDYVLAGTHYHYNVFASHFVE